MIDYAFRNITRRWVRSSLTAIGVTVMITLVIVITGIVGSQKQSMHEHASAGAGKINVQPILAGVTYPAAGIDLDEDVADDLLLLVKDHVQQMLSGKILYFPLVPPLYPNQPPEIILVGLESGKEEGFTGSVANDIGAIVGVESFNKVKADYPLILGKHAAEYYKEALARDLQPGDCLTVLDRDFIIIGILDRSTDIVVNNSLIMPLSAAQELLDKQGFVSSVILTQARVGADADIISNIQSHYPQMNVVDDSITRKNLEEGIKLFENLVNTIAAVVIVAATILIMTVTLITIKERTREIGVLRAIGATNGTIVLSIFWEIFMLSSAGSVLGGVVSGFVLRFGLMENLFNLGHILKYMPLSIVLTLVSGVLPAFRISRILPVESLRYE